MERMEENWLMNGIVGSDARVMSLRETPRMGWMDTVEKVLSESGMSVE